MGINDYGLLEKIGGDLCLVWQGDNAIEYFATYMRYIKDERSAHSFFFRSGN